MIIISVGSPAEEARRVHIARFAGADVNRFDEARNQHEIAASPVADNQDEIAQQKLYTVRY